jgi:putative ABC transport system substrate-binding protein
VKRRAFIALLGGAATWPLAARGQRPRSPVIGYLSGRSSGEAAHLTAAFRKGLNETGYVEGRNVAIEFRWADGRHDRIPEFAEELVRRQVNVIFAGGSAEAVVAKAATSTIPIVFTGGSDPVAVGLVSSLNRPEGNLTGVTNFVHAVGAKRLQLLRQLLPTAGVVGIVNPRNPSAELEVKESQAGAHALGLEMAVLPAGSEADFDNVFSALIQKHASALMVSTDVVFSRTRDRIASLAMHHRIPTIYTVRDYVVSGGLISYGASFTDAYHQTGIYVGRILKGAKPADLPVMLPTKFELVINLKTAKALGLAIPPDVLAIADEVIE